MARNHSHLGPYSRLLARGSLDGRSREGRFLAAARAELIEHIGGSPSAAQRVLIERCAWLRLHVALLDEKISNGRSLTGHDQRAYLAFSNSVIRAMRELGMRPTAPWSPSLADVMAAVRRAA